MQIAIALGGMLLLVAGAMALLVGIAWFALVVTRRLPLIGRRGKFDQQQLKGEWQLPKPHRKLPLPPS